MDYALAPNSDKLFLSRRKRNQQSSSDGSLENRRIEQQMIG
jgi:hypothetical protein